MSRRPVLDDRRLPIGYVEGADSAGRIRVLDSKLRVVGYVDTRRGETLDAQYRVVAKGSVPGLLLRWRCHRRDLIDLALLKHLVVDVVDAIGLRRRLPARGPGRSLVRLAADALADLDAKDAVIRARGRQISHGYVRIRVDAWGMALQPIDELPVGAADAVRVPLLGQTLCAGSPNPVDDFLEGALMLPRWLVPPPARLPSSCASAVRA